MKFLILIAVVLFALWLWKSSRQRADREERVDEAKPPPQRKIGEPEDMVRCPVCSLHLPRIDALPGPGGQMYCCAEHRSKGGGGG